MAFLSTFTKSERLSTTRSAGLLHSPQPTSTNPRLTSETHLHMICISLYSLVCSCDQVPTKTVPGRCYRDIQYAKLGKEAPAFQTSLSSFPPLPFYILVLQCYCCSFSRILNLKQLNASDRIRLFCHCRMIYSALEDDE